MSQDLAVDSERDRTFDLATFFSSLTLDDISPQVIHHAKLSILNSIGCGLSGATLESHTKMMSALNIDSKQTLGGPFNAATIMGRGERASIEDAAMLNGLAMTARFFDDTHLSTVVHPSGPPLAAIWAYAEANQVSGRDILLAFIVGLEAMLAIAAALGLAPYKRGWHLTSITGTFGATAALAKMANLSPTQFAQALGHASSMAAGTRGVFGTDSLSMHAGRAAQNGLLAMQMAREGLGSTTHALEKWTKLIGQGEEDATQLTVLPDTGSAVGRNWMLLENSFKPYPCGIVIHPAIDAGIAAHAHFFKDSDRTPHQALDLVLRIEARVTPLTVRLCGVQHPAKATQTIFSTYHGIAIGLIYGQAGIREFGIDVANEPLLKTLRDRIALTTDKALRDDEASLTVAYIDSAGVEAEKEFVVEHATGSLLNPMTEEGLEKKFVDQAAIGGIDGEDARHVLKMMRTLEFAEDITSLTKCFKPART